VLHREDARREDHEVDRVDADRVGRRLQHEEDRRVGVVVGDRADRVEALEVVAVRHVRAVPRDDVERRMADARRPQVAAELRDQLEVALAVLVARDRDLEIARVREAVAADDAEVGQPERRAVVLAHVAARLAVGQVDGEAHAARDHRDLGRRDVDQPELGRDLEPSVLGDDQKLAVGVVEVAVLHRPVRA
jgi:hypothetical protein